MKRVLLIFQGVVVLFVVCALGGWFSIALPRPLELGFVLMFLSSVAQIGLSWDEGHKRHAPFMTLLDKIFKHPESQEDAFGAWRNNIDDYAAQLVKAAGEAPTSSEREQHIERAFAVVRQYGIDQAFIFMQPSSVYRSYAKRHAYKLLEWDGGRDILAWMVSGLPPEQYRFPHHIMGESETA